MKNQNKDPRLKFVGYLIRFLIIFCILYYGTIAVIGLSAPGNYYVPFISRWFDYVSGLRRLLMFFSRISMEWLGFPIDIWGSSNIRFVNGRGVHIGYDCIGYGVLSFWTSFVLANKASFGMKIKWLLVGLSIIFFINIVRIDLLLLAVNKKWLASMQIDHHFWFNIFAYAAIFTMIYLYDKQGRAPSNIT